MLNIINILRSILRILQQLWSLIETFAEWLVRMLHWIVEAMQYAYGIIEKMPVWLQDFAYAIVAISIIYLILGRAGGDSSD